MGRTISAYVEDRVAKRVDALVHSESTVQAQLAAKALDLYTGLSAETRAAASAILAGSNEDREQLAAVIDRAVAGVQLAIARRRVADTLNVPGLDEMSDKEIEDFAVRESARGRTKPSRASKQRRA